MDRFTTRQAYDSIATALEKGTAPQGLPAALIKHHASMNLYFYAPRGTDKQQPHEQDEIYVVTSGAGTFAMGDNEETLERVRFGTGDTIFVPAGKPHRFENFTDDFATWVVMYGPPGGERAD